MRTIFLTVFSILLINAANAANAATSEYPKVEKSSNFFFDCPVTGTGSFSYTQTCGNITIEHTASVTVTMQPSSCSPEDIASATASANALANVYATRDGRLAAANLPACEQSEID